jgi:hypothetical protein
MSSGSSSSEEGRDGDEEGHAEAEFSLFGLRLPPSLVPSFARAYALGLSRMAALGRSHYLQYFFSLLGSLGELSENAVQWLAAQLHRSPVYLRVLSQLPLADNPLLTTARPPTETRTHSRGELEASRFLIAYSQPRRGFRVLSAIFASLEVEYHTWLDENAPDADRVSVEHLERLRHIQHIRVCPHDPRDEYSCPICRKRRRRDWVEVLQREPRGSLAALTALQEEMECNEHDLIVRAQWRYWHQLLHHLLSDEAVLVIDYTQFLAEEGRGCLLIISMIARDPGGDLHYEYYMYGAPSGSGHSVGFTQAALQHLFSSHWFRSVYIWSDSSTSDFRNAHMLLFYSLLQPQHNTIIQAHFYARHHGKSTSDAAAGAGRRRLRCILRLHQNDVYNPEFVFRVFAGNRHTTVLELELDQTYVVRAAERTSIGEFGITQCYAFSFPTTGTVNAAISSELLNGGQFQASIIPAGDD